MPTPPIIMPPYCLTVETIQFSFLAPLLVLLPLFGCCLTAWDINLFLLLLGIVAKILLTSFNNCLFFLSIPIEVVDSSLETWKPGILLIVIALAFG